MLRPQCGLLLALSMSSACDAKLGAADPAGPASALSARPPLDDESTAPRHPKPEPVEPSASARMGEEGRLPTSDRAPTEAAAPAQGVLVAELDEGCKLLGADDRYIYLSPGIFGSRRVVRVGIDGTIDHVQLDEPLAALDVRDGAILGCMGTRRGPSCRVGRVGVEGGKVEWLTTRGTVVSLAVEGDRVYSLELGKDSKSQLVIGASKGGPTQVLPFSQPSAFDVKVGVVVASTGQTMPEGMLELLGKDGAKRSLVRGSLVDHPQLDGGWVYYRDGNYRIVRIPRDGGAIEVLRSAPDDPKYEFGFVTMPTDLVWLEAKIVDGKVKPVLKRITKPAG